MAADQAGLLQKHGYTAQAEQTFRLATEIEPSSPDAVLPLVSLLVKQGRFEQAIPVVETAASAGSEKQPLFTKLLEDLKRMKKN